MLRVLLVAALSAGPALATSSVATDPSHAWALSESAPPTSTVLMGVVDQPLPSGFRLAGPRPAGTADDWLRAHGTSSMASLRRVDAGSHRPRLERRRRPAPRSADGEPPSC